MTRQTTMDMVTSLKIFTGFLFPDQFDKTMHGSSLNNMCVTKQCMALVSTICVNLFLCTELKGTIFIYI